MFFKSISARRFRNDLYGVEIIRTLDNVYTMKLDADPAVWTQFHTLDNALEFANAIEDTIGKAISDRLEREKSIRDEAIRDEAIRDEAVIDEVLRRYVKEGSF